MNDRLHQVEGAYEQDGYGRSEHDQGGGSGDGGYSQGGRRNQDDPMRFSGSGYVGFDDVRRTYGSQPQPQQRPRMPKSYQRTDERIREDIYEQIVQRQHLHADNVNVQVKDGRVTLTGDVPDRRMKHEIEDLVDRCLGVKDIENQLRVQRDAGDVGSRAPRSAISG
jgi:osmotically-inducible protein OsmY